MISGEDVLRDEDYKEIMEDVKNECCKYGEVCTIIIPRPTLLGVSSSGMGKIFVKFVNILGAK